MRMDGEPNVADDESATDLQLLQGAWSQTYLEADGVSEPPDDEHSAPGAICTFRGTTFRVAKPDGTVLLKGTFELDATTRPRTITWVDDIGADAGKALPAIYELSDRTFWFIAADEGEPYPTAFRTVQGLILREFVRLR